MIDYVKNELGEYFTISPSISINKIYENTDMKTPLIFILSQGADPTSNLEKFVNENN
jgi:dynein heavy chain